MRHDGRTADQLRPFRLKRRFTGGAPGSVLACAGRTTVLCTVSIEQGVPSWRKGSGAGWLTAEYNMVPAASQPRKPRERSRLGGRTAEIQRLIGRSLRAVVDLKQIGETTLFVDCDVLEADGGTRTTSITGAFLALVDALRTQLKNPLPLRDSVAAVSVGILAGKVLLDLDYSEDTAAEVDLNLVMTGSGRYIEVQGTGEESTFSRNQLEEMLRVGRHGIEQLTAMQKAALKSAWPFS